MNKRIKHHLESHKDGAEILESYKYVRSFIDPRKGEKILLDEALGEKIKESGDEDAIKNFEILHNWAKEHEVSLGQMRGTCDCGNPNDPHHGDCCCGAYTETCEWRWHM